MILSDFSRKISIYPPSAIFGCNESPSAKTKKAEKRITEICEDLYCFTPGALSESKASIKDYIVLNTLINLESPVKQEYVSSICAKVWFTTNIAIKKLVAMCKQDSILNSYYKSLDINPMDIESEIISTVQKCGDINMYKECLVKLKEEQDENRN